MKKIFVLSLLLMLLFAVCAFAEQDWESEQNKTHGNSGEEDSEDNETESDDELSENEIDEIKSVDTELEFENETGKVKVKRNDGNSTEVKVMPSTASEKAIEALSLNNCVEEEGCTIELKEVGEGSDNKLVYDVESEKDVKIFGFIKTKMKVHAEVDAETGEVVKTSKTWWAFMASESKDTTS